MKPSTSQHGAGDGIEDEDIPVAVLMADSFDNCFKPLTLNRPRVLLPLANMPLIDYTFASLKIAGIAKVIVYCNFQAQQIKDYINGSDWIEQLDITVITNEDSNSVGDALRDLDDKQLISMDFILIYGDLISNLDLRSILEKHKKIRVTDKNAIMTKVMMKVAPSSRHNSHSQLYALNKETGQILYLRNVQSFNGSSRDMKFPVDLLREHKELNIRTDLLDCHIIMCAAMVPSILTDNFDYQTMDDLINGVLGNQEILGHTMHVHEVTQGYAARPRDFDSYSAISMDVVEKWAYPFKVSDRSNRSEYMFGFGNNYVTKQKQMATRKSRNVVIGPDSIIGENSHLSHSVIGSNCRIGRNVRIENSFVWNGSVIEDGCVVQNSILSTNVTLHKNTQLLRADIRKRVQHIVGEEVQLGPDVKIGPSAGGPSVTMLIGAPVADEEENESEDFENKGASGVAYVYIPPLEEEESDESEYDPEARYADSDGFDDQIVPDTELFINELIDTLRRATEEKISHENIILDINSLKHAYNIQINEVNHMLIQTVLHFPLHQKKGGITESASLLKELKPLLKICLGVFKNYYRSTESQRECLNAISEYSSEAENYLVVGILCQVLMYFYNNDILEEEVICEWYEELESGPTKSQLKKLIDWLEEAEESSEESD